MVNKSWKLGGDASFHVISTRTQAGIRNAPARSFLAIAPLITLFSNR
jgi:hypothetical protein